MAVRLDPYQNIVGVSWGGVRLAAFTGITESSVPPTNPFLDPPLSLYARLYEGPNPLFEWGGQIIGEAIFTDVWRDSELKGPNLAWSYWVYNIISGSTSGVASIVVLDLGRIFAVNGNGNRCEYGVMGRVPQEITREQLSAVTQGSGSFIRAGQPWVQTGPGGVLTIRNFPHANLSLNVP